MGNLRLLVALICLGSISVACTSSAPTPNPGPTFDIEAAVAAAVKEALPTPDSQPTPDIEATVESRVQAAIDAIPTPAPAATTAPPTVPAVTPLPTPRPITNPISTPTPTPMPAPVLEVIATPAPTSFPAITPASPPVAVDPYQVIQMSVVKIFLRTRRGTSQGSGVIVGNGQHVITNAHVIDGATGAIEVSLHPESGPRIVTDGTVLFQNGNVDLALLRIEDSIGRPLELSRTLPSLGDNLVLGGFPGIGGDTLTATKGTVAGFQYDGATIKFDGQLGSGSSGGAAVNEEGKVVGIATRASGESSAGSLGILVAAPVVSAALARELLEDSKSKPEAANSLYPLSILGIPASATAPEGWDIWATFGYFDMRAPGTSTDFPSGDYRVVGIFNADPRPDESSHDFLDRLIIESEDQYQIVPNSKIEPPDGFSHCILVHNNHRYEISNFEARGTVIGTSWLSVAGLYTRFCVSRTSGQTIIGFVESPNAEVSAGDRSWLSPPTIELKK